MTMRRVGDEARDGTRDAARGAGLDHVVHLPGWEAFADEDRALRASPHVADAVMRAWAQRADELPARPRRSATAIWAVAAACVVSVLGGLSVLRQPPRHETRALPLAAAPTPAAPTARAVETVPNVAAPPPGRERMSAAYRAVADPRAAPLLTLAADPPLDGESLQIVRMRVPRHALQAFGLSTGDPEVAAVVEVDVVVGEDGLPRDIRRVRAVTDTEP